MSTGAVVFEFMESLEEHLAKGGTLKFFFGFDILLLLFFLQKMNIFWV